MASGPNFDLRSVLAPPVTPDVLVRPGEDESRIVRILRAVGVDIARRTVAKPRESMQGPSSGQCRREKALSARTAVRSGLENRVLTRRNR